MKILQVTNFFKPSWESGGPARVVYELSKKLIERGHEVTVYTTDGLKTRIDVRKNVPIYVDGIKTYYFRNISNYLTRKMLLPIQYYLPIVARKEIREFDVIHIHEHRTMLAVVSHYFAKNHNIPYVLQAHGSVLPFFKKQKLKTIFDLFFGYKILKDASNAIALTETETEQYRKMGVNEDKIKLVPNGINISEYDNLPKRKAFRKKYSIGDDEKIILYLGRIHEIKGIDLLVNAFADLAKEMDDVRLVIVGPDDMSLATIGKQIDNLKIGNRILFTGPLYEQDKLEAYVDADVYVLPSFYEAFPITVLEACACGTLVIVTDRCGIADFVDRMGYVVKYDKNQLRNTISKVLSDEGLRRRLGKECRRLVQEEFGWEKVVDKIEEIYYDVLEGNN